MLIFILLITLNLLVFIKIKNFALKTIQKIKLFIYKFFDIS